MNSAGAPTENFPLAAARPLRGGGVSTTAGRIDAAPGGAPPDGVGPPVYKRPPGSGAFNPVFQSASVAPPKCWDHMARTLVAPTPYFFV
jgi:hypothetical protein